MRFHIIWLVMFVLSCGQANENKMAITYKDKVPSTSDTLTDDFLMRAVLSIEEVKQKDRFIDSLSNHKKHVSVIIDKPEDNESDYHIRVGYDGDVRFETYYHFYMNPETRKMTIEDKYSGERMSIEDWRKANYH